MQIVLQYKSDKPIYQQIYEQITSQIIQGQLEADFCLPSIRTVARELQVSIITVKMAWQLLEENGFIYTIAGKGCFVCPYTTKTLDDKKLALATEKLQTELAYYRNLGLTTEEYIDLCRRLY